VAVCGGASSGVGLVGGTVNRILCCGVSLRVLEHLGDFN